MNPVTDPRVANVDIGAMIRCSDCNINRMVGRFSNNQLNKYRIAILGAGRSGKEAPRPRCNTCTAGNVEELRCTWCGLSKPVAEYSARHRNNPDEAKCTACQQEIDDREPDLQAATQEEEILDDYNVRNGASYSNMSSVGSALPSISGRGSEAGSVPGLYDARETGFGEAAEGVRSTSPTSSQLSTSTFTQTPSSVSYPKLSPGSVQSHGGSSSRFAKQGAYRPPIEQRAWNRAARDRRQQQQSQISSQAPTSVTHHDGGNQSAEDSDWEL
ncbi:uncharacterized protein A1O9_08950 [Exophiala aquamarina CBS 119918]|uniref:Stc1 domain-containing protein n=1 Tax=Exophiala aquamarina CBS 119918 TaxID=1182545 RepID=A0A072P649_9EURO|nr:uncharacterized protein A1O9_08950 [Exophiala aquamarina CBS 119918]KEF55296.1 hypothetical protein A1O9_08950 [Exophiala aquamarina CBS 119918]